MGSKNQKQALGLYASNYAIRMDMDVNVLHQPQKPLVQSLMHELSNYNQHPSGQNLVVAVIDYLGYNMDDAIVIIAGARTPMGGLQGVLSPLTATELGTIAIKEALSRAAIDAGYSRAITAIVDANITTVIAALVLFQFGTGPIKGFATVLFWGILISMFTAIFVTRTIFNSFTKGKQLKTLSI